MQDSFYYHIMAAEGSVKAICYVTSSWPKNLGSAGDTLLHAAA
jgi:hypothetical protein